MHTILAVLACAVQMLYQARVPTFGCNSSGEVSALQRVRSDAKAFQQLLYTQAAYGQCITISQGAVFEGTVEAADSSMLRIDARRNPPGYMAPSGDFKPAKADAQR
jgi:hypothetical protein